MGVPHLDEKYSTSSVESIEVEKLFEKKKVDYTIGTDLYYELWRKNDD